MEGNQLTNMHYLKLIFLIRGYVAYNVCASLRDALYTEPTQSDAAFGRTATCLQTGREVSPAQFSIS